MRFRIATLIICWNLCFVLPAGAQADVAADTAVSFNPFQYHTDKGFEFQTRDGRFLLQFASRLQFRFATPSDTDPATLDDLDAGKKPAFKISRARLKIGGHAFAPWLNYYFEYELSQSNLLDFRVMVEKWKWLSFKAGQWKADYNRERVISSGEQQLIERSIITKPFTLDRQQGVEVYGHIEGRGVADFNYWISVLTGTGRGAKDNDDGHLMYQARFQWNAFGRTMEMSGSDPEITPEPALTIALAGVTNQSPYTRFSQSGGGELDGFATGVPGQYRVKQAMLETAFKYRGFSWQQETHFKRINDHVTHVTTDMEGTYFQAGYFFHEAIAAVPPQLELAGIYAVYRPDINVNRNSQRQYSLVANWFFSGHKNKLTAQYDYIALEQVSMDKSGGSRFRLQWDISF